jgi:hypothetical protein
MDYMMHDPVGAVVALPIAKFKLCAFFVRVLCGLGANWDEVNPGAEPNEARWPVRIQR